MNSIVPDPHRLDSNSLDPRHSADPDVVVVGGGIGGLGSALALARAGRQVRVLERASAFGEVGAGLQLAPNATRILRDWGLLDTVIERGALPRRLIMRDAVDGTELSHLDLSDVGRRYGAPYVVIHRSDLHAILVEACRSSGVELVTSAMVTDVEIGDDGAVAVGPARRDSAALVLGADGLTSTLRRMLSDDEPISSAYVAYRGAVQVDSIDDPTDLAMQDVTVYIGPRCHLVQYPLRGGKMLNQVAVFQSPRALAGAQDWGTPDELDAAFTGTCESVRKALPALSRDRWWRMYDRIPITRWVSRRLALTGDAAHPMLQYLAQGACQALEDADCLATMVSKNSGSQGIDWDASLADYQETRTVRTARVQTTARDWGELWHGEGLFRSVRNVMLQDRHPDDYRYIDWLYAG